MNQANTSAPPHQGKSNISQGGSLSQFSTLTNLLDTSAGFSLPTKDEPTQSNKGRSRFNPLDDIRSSGASRGGKWKGPGGFPGGEFSVPGRRMNLGTPDSFSKPVGQLESRTPPASPAPPSTPMQCSSNNALSTPAQNTEYSTPPDTAQSSSGVWRPRRVADPEEKMRRGVNSLLNKLTVENFPTVGERLCSTVDAVSSATQLGEIVRLVLDKAFNESDFSELYADLCLVMSYRAPNLPSDDFAGPTKQTLFSSLLTAKWTEEFNKFTRTLELSDEQKSTLSVEDQELEILKLKNRVKVSVLLSSPRPEEHLVEGVCQMLITAGSFLDNDAKGKMLLENCLGRLQELQLQGRFSKRIECLVQDIMDARKAKWHKKVHKEKAKSLSQIKQDVGVFAAFPIRLLQIEDADLVGGSVVRAQYGIVVQLGQRSNFNNREYREYMETQEAKHQGAKL